MAAAKKDMKTKEAVAQSLPSTRRRTRDSTKEEPGVQPQPQQKEQEQEQQQQEEEEAEKSDIKNVVGDLSVSEVTKEAEEQPVKRKRGRPSNKSAGKPSKTQKVIDPSIPKRGRGRPKKVVAA